jgi:hypothetical protein
MKRTVLIMIVMLAVSHITLAQRVIGDSIYISRDSLHFKIGDQIALGSGTLPNGDFKFIYENPNWSAGKLQAAYDGLSLLLIKIKKFGSNKTGYKYFLVVETGGSGHYWIDTEPAIECGEVLKQSGKHFKNLSGSEKEKH